MYGSGHTADLKRFMEIFNAPAAVILLRLEKLLLMHDQTLIHEVWNEFVSALEEGPPEEKYSARKPSRDRTPPKACHGASSSSSRPPPEPSRPPSSHTGEPYARGSASTQHSAWQTSASGGWSSSSRDATSSNPSEYKWDRDWSLLVKLAV
jgi:hypothetical protein